MLLSGKTFSPNSNITDTSLVTVISLISWHH